MILINLESLTIFTSLYSLLIATIFFFIQNIVFNKFFIQKCGNALIILANISMMLLLTNRWLISHHFPLSNLYESTIFLAWSLTFIYLLFQKTNKTDWLGIIIAPAAMFTYGFAIIGLPQEMQKMDFLIPALQSYWLIMHVSMMIISYATLLCGSLLSMTLLIITKNTFIDIKSQNLILNKSGELVILNNTNESSLEFQNRSLILLFFKKKTFELINQLDYWGFKTISIGFPCLTIGIMSGAVWANEAWGSYWNWDPKETWALITWLIFAIYLHSRIVRHWTKEISAIIASSGFFIIWICYLGVNLLGRGLHSYGWFVK
jgi:cytochrome c-type biogenesis protein CcsB